MSSSKSFNEYVVHDLLAHIPDITSRAMFGGYGLYKDGFIFAIIVEDELYFKVDKSNQPDYERYGSQPFVYQGKNKPMTMAYWKLPAEIMENPDKLEQWVITSWQISQKGKKK